MIESKTLLIVGAGASVPYGYPAGIQLRNELCASQNLKGLPPHKVDSKGIEFFCQHFKESQLYSIDAFLAKRGANSIGKQPSGAGSYFGTYEEYGKLAIAYKLIERENMSTLFEPTRDVDGNADHWLQYLWNHMSSDVAKTEFQNNQLKIVSFNYDRVLEQYLQTAIERTYGVNETEAGALRKFIEIVHVYGNLQDLEKRAYGKTPDDFSEVANCIRVIPEARKADDEQFEKAKEMIAWAENICFIGFGFDKTNVERLGFRPDHDYGYSKKIYSTLYGITPPEGYAAQKLLGSNFRVAPSGALSRHKSLEYLRHTGFFLSL
ncbi:MAG: hypothetical protein ACXWTS_05565 [Methylococcaceae bacterium]